MSDGVGVSPDPLTTAVKRLRERAAFSEQQRERQPQFASWWGMGVAEDRAVAELLRTIWDCIDPAVYSTRDVHRAALALAAVITESEKK